MQASRRVLSGSRNLLKLFPVLLVAGCGSPTVSSTAAEDGAVALEPAHKLTHPLTNESSGLIASPRITGLYWTHNDSGDGPMLYPVTGDGSAWPGSPAKGIEVAGARNVDWEDITADDSGNLVIADVGNNENKRRDLTVYFVREPDPAAPRAQVLRAVRIAWPDQQEFPPKQLNFDCEGVFWADGKLHLLTKHRADDDTVLYRLDAERPFPEPSVPVVVGRFPIGGQVTGADTSRDGLKLAVLTYNSIWVFERAQTGRTFLDAKAKRLRIRAWQCEAVAFEPEGDTLRITNEQRDIYLLPVKNVR